MRRHNGRLFRVARAILKDDADAEDALQDAYLDAYRHIERLPRRRAARHLAHAHRRQPGADAPAQAQARRIVVPFASRPTTDATTAGGRACRDDQAESPSAATLRGRDPADARAAHRRAAGRLPHGVRHARSRGDDGRGDGRRASAIPSSTVRTRLFRARALLREALARDIDIATGDVFGFAGERCDRIVAARARAARR